MTRRMTKQDALKQVTDILSATATTDQLKIMDQTAVNNLIEIDSDNASPSSNHRSQHKSPQRNKGNTDLIEEFMLGKAKLIEIGNHKSRTLMLQQQLKKYKTQVNQDNGNEYYQATSISPWDDQTQMNHMYELKPPFIHIQDTTKSDIIKPPTLQQASDTFNTYYEPRHLPLINQYSPQKLDSGKLKSTRRQLEDTKPQCAQQNLMKLVFKRQQELNNHRSQTQCKPQLSLRRFEQFPIRKERMDVKIRSLSNKHNNFKQQANNSVEKLAIQDYQSVLSSSTQSVRNVNTTVYSVINMNSKPQQLFTSELITDSPLFKQKVTQKAWRNLLHAQNHKEQQPKYKKLADLLFAQQDLSNINKPRSQFDILRQIWQKRQTKIQQSKLKEVPSNEQAGTTSDYI